MLSIAWRERNLRAHCAYYMGKIDGVEGPNLQRGYLNFQRDNGLNPDGKYGPNTDTKLVEVIRNLQNLLNKYGYNLGVDGLAGDGTVNAIRDFQSKNGLPVDGIAGVQTYSKLNGGGGQPSGGTTWDDIPHFKKEEMTCKCGCGQNNTDLRLMQVLETIRAHFGGNPVIITSGCRCVKHNREVGGVAGSKHVVGCAADFYIKGVSTSTLLSYCQSLVNQGVIAYTYTNNTSMNGVVHINI